METYYIFLLLTVANLQSHDVASYILVMSPEHQHVYSHSATVTFICTAERPLVGCQYKWWDFDTGAGPVLNLSRGPESQADPAHLDSKLTGYRYTGRGLWTGECGISMQVKGQKSWIVACRVRPENGGWKYAWAELYADEWTPMAHNLTTPREAVVLPGGEARFMITVVHEPLLQCRFNLPGVSERILYRSEESNNSTDRYRYFGAGLRSGECGLALTNISEADNGPVKVYIRAPNWKEHVRLLVLIAALCPTAPTLFINYNVTHLAATCEVKQCRPVSNITWFLGDDMISPVQEDDSLAGTQDEWRWPWMTGNIKQTVRRQLQDGDEGKELKCVVSHMALDKPLEARQVIRPPVCGRQIISRTEPSIVDGESAYAGEFPWNVAVYKKVDDNYKFVCSGSLITTRIVVSVASCFWSRRQEENENSTFQVAAGNMRSSFSDIQVNEHVQIREVQSVILNLLYNGRHLDYLADIALLKLAVGMVLTAYVNTICIDWENRWEKTQLQLGNLGTVAGWGFTTDNELRDRLRKIDMSYVDRPSCFEALKPEQQPTLSPDKFCARHITRNANACLSYGDGGGGYIFYHKETDRYFLRGIVSGSFGRPQKVESCNEYYTSFTRVSNFLSWMLNNMNES